MNEVKYPYKPKVIVFLLSILLFGGGTLAFGKIALTNDRGLILNRIIEFSPGGATIFYWCLTIASAAFVVFGIFGLIVGLTTNKEIVLAENEFHVPKGGLSKKIVSLKYSDISGLKIQSVQNQRFLIVHHLNGKLSIPQSMLPNKKSFEELVNLVSAKVNG